MLYIPSKLLKIYLWFQDIASRAMSFSCNGWAVCILSANGAVSNVTLRQGDSSTGTTVTYEVCSILKLNIESHSMLFFLKKK
jgi:hypothetical protein